MKSGCYKYKKVSSIEDELVSFNTAKLAKQKGFNIFNNIIFKNNEDTCLVLNSSNVEDLIIWMAGITIGEAFYKSEKVYLRPTQGVLKKWLLENHYIHIDINTIINTSDIVEGYTFEVFKTFKDKKEQERNNISEGHTLYDSYEQALEIAEQEALNLINIFINE